MLQVRLIAEAAPGNQAKQRWRLRSLPLQQEAWAGFGLMGNIAFPSQAKLINVGFRMVRCANARA